MEMKYDSYYEEERVYKMTYAELMSSWKEKDWLQESHVLAYIRYCGENFRCIAPMAVRGIMSPLGMMVSDDDYQPIMSRICTEKDEDRFTDSSYNPLIEKDDFHEGNWYHSYKLGLTPVDFEGGIETYYVSDFVSLIRHGVITLQEV